MRLDKLKFFGLLLLGIIPIVTAQVIYHYPQLWPKPHANGLLLTDNTYYFAKALKWRVYYLGGAHSERFNLLKNLPQALGKLGAQVEVAQANANPLAYPEDSIMVIAPDGRIILYYGPTMELRGVVKDLQKLLRNLHGKL